MYVALIQVIQKSQYKRFVTKLLHSPILEYAQLPKAPLVILRPWVPACSLAVTNSWGPGAYPSYYADVPWTLPHEENGTYNQKKFLAVQFPVNCDNPATVH